MPLGGGGGWFPEALQQLLVWHLATSFHLLHVVDGTHVSKPSSNQPGGLEQMYPHSSLILCSWRWLLMMARRLLRYGSQVGLSGHFDGACTYCGHMDTGVHVCGLQVALP